MAPLKIVQATYFSAHDTKHSIHGLISGSGKWTSPSAYNKEVLEAEFEFLKPAVISEIHIGNFWSCTIEIFVGLSSEAERYEFIPRLTFMTRLDCQTGKFKESMKFLGYNQFAEKLRGKAWDRMKVVCRQPFCSHIRFGLSAFVVHGNLNVKWSNLNNEVKESVYDLIDRVETHIGPPKPPQYRGMNGVLSSLENTGRFRDKPLSRSTRIMMSARREKSFGKEVNSFLSNIDVDSSRQQLGQIVDAWYQKHPEKLTETQANLLKTTVRRYLIEKGKRFLKLSSRAPSNALHFQRNIENIPDYELNRRKCVSTMDSCTYSPTDSSPILCRHSLAKLSLNFEPDVLLVYNKDVLIKRCGILVQERIFKQGIKISMFRNNNTNDVEELPVPANAKAVFFKIGSIVLMHMGGNFYRPNINSDGQSLKSIFTEYSDEQISRNMYSFPPQCTSKEDLEDVRSIIPDEAMVKSECPICYGLFFSNELVSHCATCQLPTPFGDDELESLCPICNQEFFGDALDQHGRICAEKTFGM